MTDNIFNPKKLTDELLNSNLPVAGVSSTGRVDYSRELTKSEKTTATALITAHDPMPTTEEARQKAYLAAGITTEALVQALWDKVIKNDDKKATVLIDLINSIDIKIN